MKKIFLLGIIISTLLINCSSNKYITTELADFKLTESIDSSKIIILPFSQKGKELPTFSGKLISDKLSEEIFLQTNCKIINDLKIKEIFQESDINYNQNVNMKKLKTTLGKIDAKYLITGRIFQYTDENFNDLKSEYKIRVTCNISILSSGETIGVIEAKGKSKNSNIVDVITKLSKEIANEFDYN